MGVRQGVDTTLSLGSALKGMLLPEYLQPCGDKGLPFVLPLPFEPPLPLGLPRKGAGTFAIELPQLAWNRRR